MIAIFATPAVKKIQKKKKSKFEIYTFRGLKTDNPIKQDNALHSFSTSRYYGSHKQPHVRRIHSHIILEERGKGIGVNIQGAKGEGDHVRGQGLYFIMSIKVKFYWGWLRNLQT